MDVPIMMYRDEIEVYKEALCSEWSEEDDGPNDLATNETHH